MSRPDPENPGILASPDGRYFAALTSRGIIASDKVESTLWVFSASDVRNYLLGRGPAPVPQIAARIAAVPRTTRNESYGPVIWGFKWLANSRGLLFQGEGSKGERRLYEADLGSRNGMHALTPLGYDVAAFTQVGDTIACVVSPIPKPVHPGERINADAFDLTGVNLYRMLNPKPEDPLDGSLWLFRNGKRVVVQDGGKPLRVSTLGGAYFASLMVFAPSPNGRLLAVAMVPHIIPTSWTRYNLIPNLAESLAPHIEPKNPEMLKKIAEYSFVDIRSGEVVQRIGAPMATMLIGNYGGDGVYWAPDSKHVVLQNTFLPLEGIAGEESARRLYPCAAAILEIGDTQATCLQYNSADDFQQTQQGHDIGIDSAYFTGNDSLVVVRKIPAPFPAPKIDDRFTYTGNSWKRTASLKHVERRRPSSEKTLSLAFRQDLNTPPVLWATDARLHLAKQIWDPNPQLTHMNLGKASVLRWKDRTGHEWVGGLVLPPNYVAGKRYPLVLQTHGFDPTAKEFLSDGFSTTANAARPLASAGIIVLQMDMDSEHLLKPQEVEDVLDGFHSAIDTLNARGMIDPQRVGVIGFSWTCWHVEIAIVRDPQLFAAASIDDGVDMSYFQYLQTADQVSLYSEPEQLYGAKPFGPGLATWVKESTGFHMDRVRTPLLVAAAESGLSTLVFEWGVYASLRMQNKPVDLIYIPDGQHVLQKPLERLASQQTNVDWFRFWLQGYEDPDPAKTAQYRRWEGLRKLHEANEAKLVHTR